MSNATIALWARYFPSVGNDYINDQEATMLDCAWEGTIGSWYLGRLFGNHTSFALMTNATDTTPIVLLNFPDNTTTGDTTNWHHYAVTFNGSSFIGYFDGNAIVTNTAPTVDALRVGGPHKWLGISCWPHLGTPAWGDDDFPNAGWFNGTMADIRVYNKSLLASEITNLVSGIVLTNQQVIINQQVTMKRLRIRKN
jgi:hypothetical protein